MNPLINGLNTLLKTSYIAVLIKVLFEFTGFFKLQIVINNLFSFNTGLSFYFQYWLLYSQDKTMLYLESYTVLCTSTFIQII